ncbi:hypothetical protein Purlil1_13203 [Purpureocillium lilacinum]|uniref:Uncharacterized protein n=1 Tax=Purpureocillium lilacinum TaxID=33203 RepID=A0ABR0BEN8_PURLI|nr:hypothetical protein Purlil1_13203 [Purpureocillium lilacinum]
MADADADADADGAAMGPFVKLDEYPLIVCRKCRFAQKARQSALPCLYTRRQAPNEGQCPRHDRPCASTHARSGSASAIFNPGVENRLCTPGLRLRIAAVSSASQFCRAYLAAPELEAGATTPDALGDPNARSTLESQPDFRPRSPRNVRSAISPRRARPRNASCPSPVGSPVGNAMQCRAAPVGNRVSNEVGAPCRARLGGVRGRWPEIQASSRGDHREEKG